MKKTYNIEMMSNSEIKLHMMNLENEYKSIQNNIKKEANRMSELDKEYNNLKKELNKRGNYF